VILIKLKRTKRRDFFRESFQQASEHGTTN
jgi:hypothetical protein